jgi:hypothetical protein|tara:strand:- start:133 stop:276 length:144 start_codon:yes stop_codon:yes gene_type:complete
MTKLGLQTGSTSCEIADWASFWVGVEDVDDPVVVIVSLAHDCVPSGA